VAITVLGDLELGADAVGRGNEDRVLESGGLQVEQRAEAAEPCIRPAARSGPRQRRDRPDQRRSGVDIDACVLVARPANRFLAPSEMLRCARKNSATGMLCNDS
jgi:hypothetical protein